MPLQVCSGPLRLWDGIVGVAGVLHVAEAGAARVSDHSVSLTPRQHEVLGLLAEGLTEAIAERLTISLETARNHIRTVRRERDCHTCLEAVATARRLGLVA
ncbi:MAG TPA: helix-turn-helix transcriptional regulator [Gaiellaceae bacterium]|nr:helix-turn-helix transcriptional regulator [Gaiellaceae bacterium]HLG07822.1 helix-turn-helix transcriptional regulator [Gaiellaceae bacterium]